MTRLGAAAALVDGEIVPGDVDVDDGRVALVGVSPAGRGGLAAPGFVDLQVNGFGGVDLLSADPDGYRTAGEALVRTGVTAYQPTFITAPEERLVAAVRVMETARRHGGGGGEVLPRIVGAHLEGPFLSRQRLGTHPAGPRRDPERGLLERIVSAGHVTTVTLAPELPGALELVDLLRGRGILVSAGHTDADAETAHAAFDRGVRAVTHLFNAMTRMTPRRPGIVGVALTRDDVVVTLIVDGHHLAAETVKLAWRAAAGRLALVTDAIAAAGVGDGSYRLGDVTVEVVDGEARREGGTLAGSALTMIDAVRNLHQLGVPLADALDAAAAVPARLLQRGDLGVLRPGARADLVVLDDRLELRRVLVGGTQT